MCTLQGNVVFPAVAMSPIYGSGSPISLPYLCSLSYPHSSQEKELFSHFQKHGAQRGLIILSHLCYELYN